MRKLILPACLVVALTCLPVLAQAQTPAPPSPALPAAATTAASDVSTPIPVAQADIQAITQAVQFANAYSIAIAALQEKLDAANAESQRAFARAQALHPDMPISTQAWLYTPKPKAVDAKPAPPVIK